jgi:hypothetical protein
MIAGITTLGAKLIEDAADLLPEVSKALLHDLRQRETDAWSLLSDHETRNELITESGRLTNRIKHLKASRGGDGGFALDDESPQVISTKKQLTKVSCELQRLKSLDETRSARANSAARLRVHVESWVQGEGRPTGTTIVPFEGPLPELKKNENFATAIEARRRRRRELVADLNRTRSAPVPSATVRERIRQSIAAIAERGAPDASCAVELGEEIEWPVAEQRLAVISAAPQAEFAYATGNLPDAIGLIAWLLQDQLVARLDEVIAECADDANALDDKTRAEKEAEIAADILQTERDEVSLIWAAQAEGTIIDFREDCDARAILQVGLIATARAAPQGTSSWMQGFSIG